MLTQRNTYPRAGKNSFHTVWQRPSQEALSTAIQPQTVKAVKNLSVLTMQTQSAGALEAQQTSFPWHRA